MYFKPHVFNKMLFNSNWISKKTFDVENKREIVWNDKLFFNSILILTKYKSVIIN